MREFISVEEARSLILAQVGRLPVERVPLAEALGRWLAEAIVSQDDIPPFPNAAMDGYAVRLADVHAAPVSLRVVAEVGAGQLPPEEIPAGACIRIMTGAPVPNWAEAVVPVEWTEASEDGTVRILQAPTAGENIRPAGQDVQAGERFFEVGQRITPPVVAMLATLGVAEVPVFRRPRVAIVATGSELIDPGQSLLPGHIRDSAGPGLAAQAQWVGAEVVVRQRVPDEHSALEQAIEQALEADVLVFSGGVSVGAYDLVRQVLDARGTQWLFWKIRQRPGKPMAFGLLEGKPVFGLPGNPVSSALCFDQYVVPALRRMQGQQEVLRPRFPAILEAPTPKKAGLHFFTRGIVRAGADGRLHVRDTGPQGSNLYHSMVRANCLIHLPEALEEAPAGLEVQIEWLPWTIGP
ncbi:molybdopterin molybdotransferase MoeA [Rhodothermus profundi]|uniref:Molybdopterin molybdenumtransferase n=1 Tax=Rhodothermus profundi TaxID=633813 RepID=A0A1M6W387_9BACT|nr:gephyrin-like molybdotransferase Glp [Rhodothermus profundi]SHK87975.1 molybdopterin molybdochelatase [Rhodothermus profundi]